MIERPGSVLRWFFTRFFREIAFPPEVRERIQRAAAYGQVVYVCRSLSYVDYLYFTFVFLAHGLPLSRFANGVKTILMQPLGRILRIFLFWRRRERRSDEEELAEVVRAGESAMLFLKRPYTLLGWEPQGFRGHYVEQLIRLQRERGAQGRPIVFVPLVLLWGSPALRAARTRKGIIDIVFGDREAPGRLRAMYLFFSHFKESQVVAGEPIDLRRFLADEGDAPDEVLARRLRWQLGGRIESEMRVVLGPQRKGARRIGEEVLRSRRLVAEAQAIARDEKLSPATVEKRARQALGEIAADPKPWLFDFMKPLLAIVWRRIFDGFEVDMAGLERCREAARKGPLILVPSHKSHIDYLVLSYVFSENDLVPPHIAAGANLSFFPLGPLFRRGGAFFLRRSFKGDKLYGAVFRAYVRKLLREGNSIEFFIEGGRSRTGKLLAPRLGLLGMIVEAALEDDGHKARRAQVVPISIGYEKVIEEKSYARELAGGEKKKEDLGGLLRATRVLRSNYGRLNIQFDEPFPLGATLRDDGAMVAWDEDENAVVAADEHARRLATQRLAHRIVFGINRATAVTPTALVAAALLGSGRPGVTRKELLENARFLMQRARAAGGRLSQAIVDARGQLNVDALDRALDLLAGDRDLEVRSGSGTLPPHLRSDGRVLDEIYTIPDERRAQLAFYRNNAIHLFVAEALVSLALLGATAPAAGAERVVARSLLRERTLQLSRLLKLEFTYRVGETFEAIFDSTVAGLTKAGLLLDELIGDATPALRAGQPERLQLLAGQARDFVEAYVVAARAVSELGGPIAQKELVKRIRELGERLSLTGEMRRREANVDANYQNAIQYFRERGVLADDKDRKLRRVGDAQKLHAEIAALLPMD